MTPSTPGQGATSARVARASAKQASISGEKTSRATRVPSRSWTSTRRQPRRTASATSGSSGAESTIWRVVRFMRTSYLHVLARIAVEAQPTVAGQQLGLGDRPGVPGHVVAPDGDEVEPV